MLHYEYDLSLGLTSAAGDVSGLDLIKPWHIYQFQQKTQQHCISNFYNSMHYIISFYSILRCKLTALFSKTVGSDSLLCEDLSLFSSAIRAEFFFSMPLLF